MQPFIGLHKCNVAEKRGYVLNVYLGICQYRWKNVSFIKGISVMFSVSMHMLIFVFVSVVFFLLLSLSLSFYFLFVLVTIIVLNWLWLDNYFFPFLCFIIANVHNFPWTFPPWRVISNAPRRNIHRLSCHTFSINVSHKIRVALFYTA